MSEIKTKYYQTCDFCHKEVETGRDGMCCIWLPGYLVFPDGEKIRRRVDGCICNDCVERLCHKIESFLDVKEIKYGGTAIRWTEDVLAHNAHLIWDGCDGETKFFCSACKAQVEDEEASFCPHCGAMIEREGA